MRLLGSITPASYNGRLNHSGNWGILNAKRNV